MNKQTIPAQLWQNRQRPADAIAIRFKRHGKWLEWTWADYCDEIAATAMALKSAGVKPQDRIVIFSHSRVEWAVVDFAAMIVGAVIVPIYPSNHVHDIESILGQTNPSFIFIDSLQAFEKLNQLPKAQLKSVNVMCFDDFSDRPSYVGLFADWKNSTPPSHEEIESALAQLDIDQLVTIVFTSGTTGNPRGACLTHRQLVSEVNDLVNAFPISCLDSTLSFLPYSHVLGRVEIWLHAQLGFTLNFAESLDTVARDLRDTQPTVILGVPRIFEKIYVRARTEVDRHWWSQKLYQWSRQAGALGDLALNLTLGRPVRQFFGGRLRFAVCGGAPLDPQVHRFFERMGIVLLEGYGLTETTGAIFVNVPKQSEAGTVGRPLKDVEIRLADDGEILVRSAKVMAGYWRDGQINRQSHLDANGFFPTGDIGQWTPTGHLKITDRKKDLIKTSGGKYVSPQKLEALLKRDPLIAHAIVYGEGKKNIVALISLEPDSLRRLAEQKNWPPRDYASHSRSNEVKDYVRQIVSTANEQLASFETIKNFSLLTRELTVESGELTPSLKVRRKFVSEKFKADFEGLY